jgi:hypothetical protein
LGVRLSVVDALTVFTGDGAFHDQGIAHRASEVSESKTGLTGATLDHSPHPPCWSFTKENPALLESWAGPRWAPDPDHAHKHLSSLNSPFASCRSTINFGIFRRSNLSGKKERIAASSAQRTPSGRRLPMYGLHPHSTVPSQEGARLREVIAT